MVYRFFDNTGEKSAKKRPVAVLIVIVTLLVLGVLTYMGETSPWSPHMTAWSENPIPVVDIRRRTPLQLRGADLFQNKQCRNCHALGGLGGQRGPALDDIASRLTADEMVRQIIQGGGNMPAYGKKLRPAEVDAIVAFMKTLRPGYRPTALVSVSPQAR